MADMPAYKRSEILLRAAALIRERADDLAKTIAAEAGKALKFARAVTKTLELLALFPEMGAIWESKNPRLQGVRFQNVHRFRNYLIFYRITDPGLYVE